MIPTKDFRHILEKDLYSNIVATWNQVPMETQGWRPLRALGSPNNLMTAFTPTNTSLQLARAHYQYFINIISLHSFVKTLWICISDVSSSAFLGCLLTYSSLVPVKRPPLAFYWRITSASGPANSAISEILWRLWGTKGCKPGAIQVLELVSSVVAQCSSP